MVILALNPRKSGQIANKGFMIYYDRYRSHAASNPEKSQAKLGVIAYLCLTLTSQTLHCHFPSLQAANCWRNSRLAVDEDALKRVKN